MSSDDETDSLDSVVVTKVTSPNGSLKFDIRSTVVSEEKKVPKANRKTDDEDDDDRDDNTLLETPTFRRIWERKPITMDDILISMDLKPSASYSGPPKRATNVQAESQLMPTATAHAGSKAMSLPPKNPSTGRHDGQRQHKWMINFWAALEKRKDGTLSSLSRADPLLNFRESQSDLIQDLWKKQDEMGMDQGKQE